MYAEIFFIKIFRNTLTNYLMSLSKFFEGKKSKILFQLIKVKLKKTPEILKLLMFTIKYHSNASIKGNLGQHDAQFSLH